VGGSGFGLVESLVGGTKFGTGPPRHGCHRPGVRYEGVGRTVRVAPRAGSIVARAGGNHHAPEGSGGEGEGGRGGSMTRPEDYRPEAAVA
jgi:hypothetical protein